MPKKDEIKAKFTVSLKNVFNLEDCDGKSIFIAYKRGSKATNSGETKRVTVSGKIAVFGEEFIIDSTLMQDTKSKKWDSKKIEFTLKEDVKKKAKPLGKATLDLAEYSKNSQFYDSISLPIQLKKKKDKGPSLKLSIKCAWTHLNKKKIVAPTPGKEAVDIDGEKVGLETADDLSDEPTTVGDHSSDEASDIEDDDFKEMVAKPSAPASQASAPRKSMSSDDKDPKKRIAELEKQLDEKDKLIRKYENDVAKLRDDLNKEKDKTREKLMKVTGQKEEVKKLKKELADAKKKGATSSTGDVSSSSEVLSLREQVDNLTKEKNALVQELQLTKKSGVTVSKGGDSKLLEEKDKEIGQLKAELQRAKDEAERLRRSGGDLGTSGGKSKDGDSVSKKEYDKVLKSLQKRNEEIVGMEKSSREKDKQIEKLQDDVERLEKNLKGLYEVGSNKKSAGGNENGGAKSNNSAELAQLTKENREQKMKIERQDKEIAKLKERVQEAEEAASSASTRKSGGGGGDDTDALRQKLKKMETEREEMSIIEDHVYCMTPRYEDGIHISAQQITDILMEKGALDDPPNERLLARILKAMKKCYQADSYDNNTLVPWLSFACMLHESLETEVGTSEDANSGDIPSNGIHVPREGESHDDDDDDPITTFFHNLEMLIFEIYSAVLRNFYTQLNEVVVAGILQLSSCIMENRSGKQPPSKNELKSFTPVLTECYMLLKRHAVFDSVLQQFFCQAFYFINASLFNNLLKRKELCTCSSGFRIKLGLSQLEEWTNTPKLDKKIITDPKKDKKILTFAARNNLKHVTEAATVLVVGKEIFLDAKATHDAFPTLTPVQLKHLLESFQPDQWAPDPVPKKVMAILDGMIEDEDEDAPFELDENYLLSLNKIKQE